ncbi:hypothetical protein HYT18_03835 [Candidatus Microgenomates bacterium]|nr:hypothetical protein [Candidatus Microgenomates bacterium]
MIETGGFINPLDSSILEFSRARKQREQRDRISSVQNRNDHPKDPGRRKFLLLLGRVIGGAAAASALGISGKILLDKLSAQSDNPYRDWGRYKDRYFPKELVIAMGHDISQSSDLPGFSEVGELIVLSQTNPDQLQRFIPLYNGSEPMKVRLTNLLNTTRALGSIDIGGQGVGVETTVVDRHTGEETKTVIARVDEALIEEVRLDNSFIYASNIAKKLILAKEFSHLLYIREHQKTLAEAVLDRYEIMAPNIQDIAPHLYFSANAVYFTNSTVPPIDQLEAFAKVGDDLDCSGHWHTAPAFGTMKYRNLLSPEDLAIFDINDSIFEAAKNKGLLVHQGSGVFSWRSNIGPFSSEWLSLCRPLWRAPSLKLP